MSLSNEWLAYHLTPRGWEMGSNKKDFGMQVTKDPPADRVLTVHCTEKQSSSFSKMVTTNEVTYRSDKADAVQELTASAAQRVGVANFR